MPSLELKVPPPVIVIIVSDLMSLVSQVGHALTFAIPARIAVAISIAVFGVGIGVAGIITFTQAKTTVNPTTPEASSSLVTWGIYSITRNPMYLGLLLLLTAWAVYLSNPFPFLLVPVYVLYINRFQIAPEERVLTSLFGSDFTTYQSRVRRWI